MGMVGNAEDMADNWFCHKYNEPVEHIKTHGLPDSKSRVEILDQKHRNTRKCKGSIGA